MDNAISLVVLSAHRKGMGEKESLLSNAAMLKRLGEIGVEVFIPCTGHYKGDTERSVMIEMEMQKKPPALREIIQLAQSLEQESILIVDIWQKAFLLHLGTQTATKGDSRGRLEAIGSWDCVTDIDGLSGWTFRHDEGTYWTATR